jgi:outer membrane protein assembly factor BamA
MIPWTAALLISARVFLQAQPEPGGKEAPPAKSAPDPSLYALPSISSDKNSGVTYGLMGALLLKDEKGRTDWLFTATLAYQHLIGWNGDVNVHFYPTVTSEAEFDAVLAQRVESELKLNYKDLHFLEDYDLSVDFHELRLSTARFFGRSEDAPHSDQSVYTSNSYRLAAAFGPRLSDEVSIQGTARWRKFRVGPSLINGLPQTLDRYPEEPGIEGGHVLGPGVALTFDSRDQATTPSRGALGLLYAERMWSFSEGPSLPFWVLGAQWTGLFPLDADAGFVSVVHVQVQVTDGRRIPFWELSALGGISTLRSFYEGRFTEKDLLLLNLEERIRLFSVSLMGTSGEVQIAPFFDVGKVFDSLGDVFGSEAFDHYHYSFGLGIRGVVPPSFLGRLDVAWGREGFGVTVGLDYPF